jgi:protein virilizer
LTIAALRTMLLLTEHDVTIKVLKCVFKAKDEKIVEKFNAIAEKCKNDRKVLSVVSEILELFRAMLNIEVNPLSVIPQRTITVSVSELASILKWNVSDEYTNGNKVHFLEVFSGLVTEEDEDGSVKSDLDVLLEQLKASTNEAVVSSDEDIALPQAEGIVTQFSSRAAFYVTDHFEDLTLDYWLLNTCDDDEIQLNDQVQFDLDELVRECLPPDTNIASDCKRLFALSSSPQSNTTKGQTGLCFRTRKVEVNEPTPGRPEKIFGKCKILNLNLEFYFNCFFFN